jgi:flagellar hook assembly protein FlgD
VTPNPSRGSARLEFALPSAREVSLRLYDVRGARVRTLVEGRLEPGVHVRAWDGRDEHGGRVHAGVYFAELRSGAEVLRRSLVRVE